MNRLLFTSLAGRVAAQGADAQAKPAATVRINTLAAWDWNRSEQPAWLTKTYYSEKIQPILASTSRTAIANIMKCSRDELETPVLDS